MIKTIGVSVTAFLLALFASSGAYAEPPKFEPFKVIVQNDDSNPVPVVIQGSTQSIVEYRYVGDTSVDDVERAGDMEGLSDSNSFAVMHRLCRNSFEGGRAATISEVLLGSSFNDDGAWVIADGVNVYANTDLEDGTERWHATDSRTAIPIGSGARVSAFLAADSAQCRHFTTDSAQDKGPIIDEDGNIRVVSCDSEYPIACSAPTIIQVQ